MMHCIKKIADDLYWVGANDRRLAMFEGVYAVPDGVSYNSYLLIDDKTVLFDTVDKAVSKTFFENIEYVLAGRNLDYVVVHHMEPDHSSTLAELIRYYPNVKIICNKKTASMINQFFSFDVDSRLQLVDENDSFETAKHSFRFIMAPMVHWPEVMLSYDEKDNILFSADAFGSFKALNGAIFADEVNFDRDYLDEARRYYCNIVGKYGKNVQSVLQKVSDIKIKMICPLHGFVWRKNINYILDKYIKWSSYESEEKAVMIAYASVYGNTENVAEIISCKLRDLGINTAMYDVSVTPSSYIVAKAFCFSHLIFASTTYNAGVFISMDEVLRDIVSHNIQNKTVALVENGSWAPNSAKLMREILKDCKNINFIENTISIKSSLQKSQLDDIDRLVSRIACDFDKKNESTFDDNTAVFKIPYGLYLLSCKDEQKDNACIINTMCQITDTPDKTFSMTLNKQNYSHNMIMNNGKFNVCVLTEDTSFEFIKKFGFESGKQTNKFDSYETLTRSQNGLVYLKENVNSYISCEVLNTIDCGSHTLFIARQTQSKVLSDENSLTYKYYLDNIKPKKANNKVKSEEENKGFVCTVCGYVYNGDTLPSDYICPLCKHGADVFEKIK